MVSAAGPAPPPPVVAPTVTGTPKQAETRLGGQDVLERPGETRRPSRTRAAWVMPGGISSMWWVTSTSGGHRRVGGQLAQPGHQPLTRPEVEPGRRLVEQQQLGPAHERPGQQHLLALALGDHAELPVADPARTPEACRASSRSAAAQSSSV